MAASDRSALLAGLTGELGRLLDDALRVEPAGGVNDAWAKVLVTYGVERIGAAEREATRKRLNLARGALPAEVAACVRVIAERFAAAVDDPRLVEAATVFWRSVEGSYLEHACWRPRSMFAFAVQSAAQAGSRGWQRPPGGYVITCTRCGGPRLTEELVCQFCRTEKLGT